MKKEVKLLVTAIKEKNIRSFLSLLNNLSREDMEFIDEQTGLNVIHICAQENAAKELLLIISQMKNVNLNIKSKGLMQKTPVEISFAMGYKEVSKVLLQGGAILPDPKEAKKTFKNDSIFQQIIDEALKNTNNINNNINSKNAGEKKKKGFFSFAFNLLN